MNRNDLREVIWQALYDLEYKSLAQDSYENQADYILSAFDAAGLVVVPKEPTEAMARAGSLTLRDTFRAEFNHAKAIYRAMIAAEDA